jgi:hypothetical protein
MYHSSVMEMPTETNHNRLETDNDINDWKNNRDNITHTAGRHAAQ